MFEDKLRVEFEDALVKKQLFVPRNLSESCAALTRWRQSHRIKTAASTIIVTLATHRR